MLLDERTPLVTEEPARYLVGPPSDGMTLTPPARRRPARTARPCPLRPAAAHCGGHRNREPALLDPLRSAAALVDKALARLADIAGDRLECVPAGR